MLKNVRLNGPFMIGSAVLIILLDLIDLLYRAAGLPRGVALYLAALTVGLFCTWLVHRHFRRK